MSDLVNAQLFYSGRRNQQCMYRPCRAPKITRSIEVERFYENILVLEPSPPVCRAMADRCLRLGDEDAATLWRNAAAMSGSEGHA